MSKRALSVATLMLLAWAAPVEAQCRKRILLYVDLSQSMGQRSPSPFDQTIDAARELLRQPDVMSAGDSLRVIGFGGGLLPAREAQDPTSAETQLGSLQRPNQGRTDLTLVLGDAVEALSRATTSDASLVVIASDFAHDPDGVPTGDAGARGEHWARVFNAKRAEWAGTFVGTTDQPAKGRLALLRADVYATGGVRQVTADRDVARRVLQDLRGLTQSAIAVGSEPGDPQRLGAWLAKLLYVLPEVKTRLTGEFEFEVTARNRGCMPLTLTDVKINCDPPDGGAGIPARFDEAAGRLAPVGSQPVSRAIRVDVKELHCKGSKYSVAVGVAQIEEAALGEPFERKTNIGHEVLSASLARSPIGRDRAQVRFKLWGIPVGDDRLQIKLKPRTGPELIFSANMPEGLSKEQESARDYRVSIPVDASFMPDGKAQFEINAARGELAGTLDLRTRWVDTGLWIVGGGGLGWIVLLLLYVARRLGRGTLTLLRQFAGSVKGAAEFIGGLSNLGVRIPFGHPYDWALDEPQALGCAVGLCLVGLACLAALTLRIWKEYREAMQRAAFEGGGSIEPEEYDRQMSMRAVRIAVLGVAALGAAVLLVGWWFKPDGIGGDATLLRLVSLREQGVR